MAKGKAEYNGGTVVAVVARNESGKPTNCVQQDGDGNQWHCVDGKDAVLIRDADDYAAALASA